MIQHSQLISCTATLFLSPTVFAIEHDEGKLKDINTWTEIPREWGILLNVVAEMVQAC